MKDVSDIGYYESLVVRILRLSGFDYMFLLDRYTGITEIGLVSGKRINWKRYKKLKRSELSVECIETTCRTFLEHWYCIPDFEEKRDAFMFDSVFSAFMHWLEQLGIGDIISKSFSELDLKLSLLGA